MHIILCLDKNNGMLFHNRRQSRDCKVIENIFAELPDQLLYIQPFSKTLFADYQELVCITEMLTDSMTCFLEQPPPKTILDRANRLTIYRWDKVYPADQKLDMPLSYWLLQSIEMFPGKSHATITKEVYIK